jgi:hypothetical protein
MRMYTRVPSSFITNIIRRWSAVVRGAACKGMEGDHLAVVKRKSRRHYGTSCNRLFKYRVHRESDSYIDEYTGEKWANNQMSYLIKKGQDLNASSGTHGQIALTSNFWVDEPRYVTWKLLACDAEEAPQRSVHKVRLKCLTRVGEETNTDTVCLPGCDSRP